MSDMRRIIRVNRLLAEVGHADVIDALEELKRLRTAKPAGGYCVEDYNCVCGGDTPGVRATCDNWRK